MTIYQSELATYTHGLLARMRERGYIILHAGDLRATRETDLCRGRDPVRAAARQQWDVAARDAEHEKLLNDMTGGLNGYIDWPYKAHTGLCALPDHDGAARQLAAANNLHYARLRAAGVTDTDVYAVIAAHEYSHAMGNNGEGEEGPTSCEYSAYALHTARLLRAGMNPDNLMLVTCALARQSFMSALRSPTEEFTYDRVISGASWAAQHAHDPTVWDERADAFTPEAYDYLRQQALRIQRNDNAALHEALRALNRTRMLRGVPLDEDIPGFADKFCRAADRASAHLRKKGHLTAHGPDDKLQAALLLRQAARSFRLLQNFAL